MYGSDDVFVVTRDFFSANGLDVSKLKQQQNKNGEYTISFDDKPLFWLKLSGKTQYIRLRPDHLKDLIPAKIPFAQSSDGFLRVDVGFLFGNFQNALLQTFLSAYRNNIISENFGCCHLYVECSDALQCVHWDQVHALGCDYKKNLDAGRVFYGKNRNTDSRPATNITK